MIDHRDKCTCDFRHHDQDTRVNNHHYLWRKVIEHTLLISVLVNEHKLSKLDDETESMSGSLKAPDL